MIIELPENVQSILDKLEDYGAIGYVVGGCVRDSILGRVPKDWDICTPLLPDVVKKIFKDYHIVETGIKHGTVSVIIENESYEITTYRTDGIYSDGRHPDNVYYTDRLEDDLKRRDFTINAMAYNPKTGLIDIFDGINDLRYGIIKCVGVPYERFNEDGLRILRAVRFAAVLGFKIEYYTALDMNNCIKMLDGVSKERIMAEIVRMLSESNPHSLVRVLNNYEKVFFHIFPKIGDGLTIVKNDEIISNFLWDLSINIMRNTSNDVITRLAVLFEDTLLDKEMEDAMKEYRFDNATIKSVKQLTVRHELYHELTGDIKEDAYQMRVILHDIGIEQTFRLLNIWRANVKAKTNIGKYNRLRDIDIAQMLVEKAISEGQCFTLKNLDITGDDLIDIGYKPGIEVGETLNKLLREVMMEPFKNKKNWLLNWARKELEGNASNK